MTIMSHDGQLRTAIFVTRWKHNWREWDAVERPLWNFVKKNPTLPTLRSVGFQFRTINLTKYGNRVSLHANWKPVSSTHYHKVSPLRWKMAARWSLAEPGANSVYYLWNRGDLVDISIFSSENKDWASLIGWKVPFMTLLGDKYGTFILIIEHTILLLNTPPV